MFLLCFRALSTQQDGYVRATNLYYYYYYYYHHYSVSSYTFLAPLNIS